MPGETADVYYFEQRGVKAPLPEGFSGWVACACHDGVAHATTAHRTIRRDHAGQHGPGRTLQEAGILAALKSWQKDQDSALIQYSLAKFIHPMKNAAAAGMVRIDRSEGSFRVDKERNLEERLEKH